MNAKSGPDRPPLDSRPDDSTDRRQRELAEAIALLAPGTRPEQVRFVKGRIEIVDADEDRRPRRPLGRRLDGSYVYEDEARDAQPDGSPKPKYLRTIDVDLVRAAILAVQSGGRGSAAPSVPPRRPGGSRPREHRRRPQRRRAPPDDGSGSDPPPLTVVAWALVALSARKP